MSSRREFITLLGGAAAWPLAARAQQAGMPVIGFLGSSSPADRTRLVTAFRQGIRETGYVEGQSVAIEYRWAQDQYDRLPDLAADLVRRQVAVIAAHDTLSAIAAKAATATIPIVFATAGDPVKDNLVGSLNRPGGNVTGVSFISVSVSPRIEFETAFAAMMKERPDAFAMTAEPFHQTHIAWIMDFMAKNRLPAVYQLSENVRAGGLMSYGASQPDLFRRAAGYVHRILQGTKPADLPVELARKFDLAVNLKTAKALGLELTPTFTARADEVIE